MSCLSRLTPYFPLRHLLLSLLGSLAIHAFVIHHASGSPDDPQIRKHARYMGTGSCSASTCHGSVNPIKGSRVLQNEYHTWLKHDRHSKAYSVLMTHDARKIAEHLKLGDPTNEPQCLECHSTFVPDRARQGDRYTIEDGVSCESCHGAAEGWLASHSEAGATHAGNIANGLADTVSLESRARLCLSCHYGDQTKRVTHKLYGAGHPRLRFELDTYGILQPKHWIVDNDYKTRKGDYIPIRAWFMGQAAHADSLLLMLRNPHDKSGSSFPELSLFDCFSCHHSLSSSQWKTRDYAGHPGTIQLNLAPLRLIQGALRVIDLELSTEIGRLSDSLNTSYAIDGATQTISELTSLVGTRLRSRIANIPDDPTTCMRIVQGLSQLALQGPSLKFEVAEQVGMGIQAALATSPILAQKHGAQLSLLFKTIESADSFEPQRFTEALRRLS